MMLFTTGIFYALGPYVAQLEDYGDPYRPNEAFAFHLINLTYTLWDYTIPRVIPISTSLARTGA